MWQQNAHTDNTQFVATALTNFGCLGSGESKLFAQTFRHAAGQNYLKQFLANSGAFKQELGAHRGLMEVLQLPSNAQNCRKKERFPERTLVFSAPNLKILICTKPCLKHNLKVIHDGAAAEGGGQNVSCEFGGATYCRVWGWAGRCLFLLREMTESHQKGEGKRIVGGGSKNVFGEGFYAKFTVCFPPPRVFHPPLPLSDMTEILHGDFAPNSSAAGWDWRREGHQCLRPCRPSTAVSSPSGPKTAKKSPKSLPGPSGPESQKRPEKVEKSPK